jgi:alkaline phosphatase D
MLALTFLLLALACAEALYEGNLNYQSPSKRHDHFGINIPKVSKRLIDDRKLMARGTANLNFTHGVASGDPFPNSVILWSRLAPITNKTLTTPICVTYQVSTSKAFSSIITKGTAYTSSDVDYTVKVEATGLAAFTTYYYRFMSCDGMVTSVVGRTKTAPHPNDKLPNGIKFAVYSCSNYRISPPLSIFAYGSAGIFQCLRGSCPPRFCGLRSSCWRLHLRICRGRM